MLKVKIVDEAHEEDLQKGVNAFLEELDEHAVKDIKFHTAIAGNEETGFEYLYSAMIIYREAD